MTDRAKKTADEEQRKNCGYECVGVRVSIKMHPFDERRLSQGRPNYRVGESKAGSAKADDDDDSDQPDAEMATSMFGVATVGGSGVCCMCHCARCVVV